MGRKVFVDTSGWYALIDSRDAAHERAERLIRQLLHGGSTLVTTDYVIDESCTLANVRAGAVAATRLLDLCEQTRLLAWEWIGVDRFGRASSWFRKQRDQGFSFTDCTSFVVMKELKVEEAVTTDDHFRIAGFRPLLRLAGGR